jgi:7-cyano-7-deazaguanine reductase
MKPTGMKGSNSMKKKALDSMRWDIQDISAVKPELLLTLDYEYPGKEIAVRIETDEFGAVCPWSGLPDFGTLIVEYVPDAVVVELKSFKYYLYTFRSVGIYQEHAVNRIYEDLSLLLKPRSMKITLTYRIRGGLLTAVTREK